MITDEYQIVGVLNVTPDSFSDGGAHFGVDAAVPFAKKLYEDGSDIVDIGGQSTRPGYTKISAKEELSRVEPVLKEMQKINFLGDLSVDTYYPEVAEVAFSYGVNTVNYTYSFDDENMLKIVKKNNMCCIFNFLGSLDSYKNFVNERIKLVEKYGIEKDKVIFDPGIGFGKTFLEDIDIIMNPLKYKVPGYPIYLGISRKRVVKVVSVLLLGHTKNSGNKIFKSVNKHENYLNKSIFFNTILEEYLVNIKRIANYFSARLPEEDFENIDSRDFLTGVLSIIAINNGANFIRVHNVQLLKKMLKLARSRQVRG